MGVSPSGGSNGGGGITGGRDQHPPPPPEHSLTVHCDHAHYGPVCGGSAVAGVKGGQAVVVAGQIGLVGGANGGLVGETDGGGGVNRREGDVDVLIKAT